MQLKLPFRLTRGATVVLVIVFAHLIIAALFIRMRVKAPEMGPVFATILVESPDSDREAAAKAPRQDVAQPATAPATR